MCANQYGRRVEGEIDIARRSGESLDDWCTRVVQECADARRQLEDERTKAEGAEREAGKALDLTAAEARLQDAQAEVLLAFEAWRLQLPQ